MEVRARSARYARRGGRPPRRRPARPPSLRLVFPPRARHRRLPARHHCHSRAALCRAGPRRLARRASPVPWPRHHHRRRRQPAGAAAGGPALACCHSAPGEGSHPEAPAIAISAHLDTVFPASTPLHVRRDQALLLGPGISDNGSGLAALWALAAAFQEAGILTALPLLFIANVGEEGEGNLRGMKHLYRQCSPAADANSPGPTTVPRRPWLYSSPSMVPAAKASFRKPSAAAVLKSSSPAPAAIPGAITARPIPSSPPPSWSKRFSAFLCPSIPAPPSTSAASRAAPPSTPFPSAPSSRLICAPSDPHVLDDLEQRLRRAVQDACD